MSCVGHDTVSFPPLLMAKKKEREKGFRWLVGCFVAVAFGCGWRMAASESGIRRKGRGEALLLARCLITIAGKLQGKLFRAWKVTQRKKGGEGYDDDDDGEGEREKKERRYERTGGGRKPVKVCRR